LQREDKILKCHAGTSERGVLNMEA
jgi:hypothetical protein